MATASFLDCGLPSTVGAKNLAPVAKAIIARLNESAPDLIVIELGDGILGGYSVESVFEDDELRQAMTEHKAALLRYATYPYVETIDGLGTLTGARREQDAIFSRSQHWERLRYKIGVKLLPDGIERFYLPGTVWEVASMGEKECPASDPPSPPLPAESIPGVKRTRPLLCDQ